MLRIFLLSLFLVSNVYAVDYKYEVNNVSAGVCFVSDDNGDLHPADVRAQGTLQNCEGQLYYHDEILWIPTDAVRIKRVD